MFFSIVLKKKIIIIISVVVVIVAIVLGLTAYSYTQLSVSFSDVSSIDIQFKNLSWTDLVKLGLDVLSGNWIKAALDVIVGINLGLDFELSNNGLLPVYIPELSYDLSINGIPIGKGSSEINTTINPGEIKKIQILQNFEQDSFDPVIESVINQDGVMIVGVNGIAHFELLGQKILVPFESSKQVSIIDEIQNQLYQQRQN